jgi:dipeptidyl aminopeptidase/acylaminoacyl peptidase
MPDVVRYGPHADQFAEVCRPAGAAGPVVVLIHGGYWRPRYGCDLMRPLAADLCSRGYTAVNLEYRRVGWPGIFEDVAAGLAAVRTVHKGRLALVGHSAGGQLALWAAGERASGVSLVVSLAGITDLVEGARRGLSDGAVRELLGGGPDEVPDRYRAACPTLRLPLRVPHLVVHGTDDDAVPYDFAGRYVAAARAAGDPCELLALPGVAHFALIDPGSAAWTTVLAHLDGWARGAGYEPGTKTTSTQ